MRTRSDLYPSPHLVLVALAIGGSHAVGEIFRRAFSLRSSGAPWYSNL